MIIHKPLHPGVIVKNALIDEAGLSVTEAANKLGVTRTTLSRLLNGHTGLSPEMWVNIQAQYDVWTVQQRQDQIDVKPLDKAA